MFSGHFRRLVICLFGNLASDGGWKKGVWISVELWLRLRRARDGEQRLSPQGIKCQQSALKSQLAILEFLDK